MFKHTMPIERTVTVIDAIHVLDTFNRDVIPPHEHKMDFIGSLISHFTGERKKVGYALQTRTSEDNCTTGRQCMGTW